MAQESNGAGQQFLFDSEPVIKGFPELRWTGKRPYRSTQYYPAQLRESYGDPSVGPDGKPWMNKIYWGDNLQVMSHLLKDYRGKVDLIYIDPPFDSKADYKKKIKLRGKKLEGDQSAFEEKQYGDIWNSDEYLQFIYERLVIMNELLSDTGCIYLHCDWHRSHQLRLVMDEVFGADHFVNEVIWHYSGAGVPKGCWAKRHDNIFLYSKSKQYTFNADEVRTEYAATTVERFSHTINNVRGGIDFGPQELNPLGKYPEDVLDVSIEAPSDNRRTGYPTQKPEALLEKLIKASSNPGDLVFDCFMGSGTTPAMAMKLGRRFIGADINLGSIQTTTKRLLGIAKGLSQQVDHDDKYLGFEVYNVNNYDFFRNPVEARDLLIQALDIQPLSAGSCFDGELDGRMVKILPTNRIATRADLEGLVADLPYDAYDARKEENPNTPVDHITLVCMGHEPDLKAAFEAELNEYKIDVEIVDVLQDKRELEFKREAEANVAVEGGRLIIKSFYPMNLLQKLSLQREAVDDWRELVESVMVDWNYDGAVMEPTVIDIPEKDEFVAGTYDIPDDAGRIKVKITDVLSESLEVEVGA